MIYNKNDYFFCLISSMQNMLLINDLYQYYNDLETTSKFLF